jgi:hypothetical protein
MPFRLGADAVTRDTGLVVNDRDSPADDAIKQRRFTDIGPAHNSDDSLHTVKMLHRGSFRKQKCGVGPRSAREDSPALMPGIFCIALNAEPS